MPQPTPIIRTPAPEQISVSGQPKPRLLDLPHGYQTQIDEDDAQLIAGLTLYRGKNGYVYYSLWEAGKSVPRTLHALLMGSHPGMHVDHINGDKLDNCRSNLRVVAPSVNQINRKRLNKNNQSGVRGVSWVAVALRWRAQITVGRQNFHLGMFVSKDEAIEARRAAELRYYGEQCP